MQLSEQLSHFLCLCLNSINNTDILKVMISDNDEVHSFALQQGQVIVNGKYKIMGKLGCGPYSSIHAISMIKSQKLIVRAIKEKANVKQPQINSEVTVLNRIKQVNEQEIGFAKIYEYGFQSDYNYMVMSMLGPNLQQLLKLCGGTFSLKTTMTVGLQILDRLQRIHNQGFVYGDVRPENFVVGLGAESPFIFIIDFGNCKRYKNKGTNQHIIYKENVSYNFNPTFASTNAHNHIQYSRRDDIQSLLYLIIFMRSGKLPWIKQSQSKRMKNSDAHMQQIKKRITPESLCFKMPLQMIDLTYYIKSIEFYQKPDYNFVRKMVYRCLERENIEMDIIYDWNTLEEIDYKVYSGDPRIVYGCNEKLQQNSAQQLNDSQTNKANQNQSQQQQKLI